jgi:hypothetical protein
MKKKISNILFRSVLETEFFLLSSNLKKNNSSTLGVLISKSKILVVELFELIKNLKQLIRTMQFLDQQQKKKLILYSSNKNITGFLHLYLSELYFSQFINVQSQFLKVNSNSNSKSTRVLLLLEKLLKENSANFLKKNISVVSKVNSKLEPKNAGIYKIHNDVSNYKKLAFIVTLLHQIFEKENKK